MSFFLEKPRIVSKNRTFQAASTYQDPVSKFHSHRNNQNLRDHSRSTKKMRIKQIDEREREREWYLVVNGREERKREESEAKGDMRRGNSERSLVLSLLILRFFSLLSGPFSAYLCSLEEPPRQTLLFKTILLLFYFFYISVSYIKYYLI